MVREIFSTRKFPGIRYTHCTCMHVCTSTFLCVNVICMSLYCVGVPKETSSILKLREAVDAFRGPSSGPVLVHCRYVGIYPNTHLYIIANVFTERFTHAVNVFTLTYSLL